MKTIRFTKGTRIYNAGELATFPDADADHYIKQGGAYECDREGNPLQKPKLTVASGGGLAGDAAKGYSSMSKQELVDLAQKRELTVVRREGEGEPVKSDYIAVLEEADEATNGDTPTDGGNAPANTEAGDGGTEGEKPEGSAEGEGE